MPFSSDKFKLSREGIILSYCNLLSYKHVIPAEFSLNNLMAKKKIDAWLGGNALGFTFTLPSFPRKWETASYGIQ
jgi:hypothetical protein